VTALLGPNGAGKTTLFSLITRLFDAPTGRIEICGRSAAEWGARALGPLGVVFQQPTLDLDLTVKQNLRYFAALRGLKRKDADERMLRALKALDMAERIKERVRSLAEADPYVVLRVWLDKPVGRARNAFYTCSRFRYLDSLALYSQFQEPYVSWAQRTGGSVVEAHAYAIAPDAMAPAAQLRAALLDETTRMLPELTGARVLHEEMQIQDNFTRWAPGDRAQRPGIETPFPNLFLAGDHVALPMPAALMEAATISGRMAANGILHAEGLREIPITTVSLEGPLS